MTKLFPWYCVQCVDSIDVVIVVIGRKRGLAGVRDVGGNATGMLIVPNSDTSRSRHRVECGIHHLPRQGSTSHRTWGSESRPHAYH